MKTTTLVAAAAELLAQAAEQSGDPNLATASRFLDFVANPANPVPAPPPAVPQPDSQLAQRLREGYRDFLVKRWTTSAQTAEALCCQIANGKLPSIGFNFRCPTDDVRELPLYLDSAYRAFDEFLTDACQGLK